MTDEEFEKLKKKLERVNNYLEKLQWLYQSETGRRWLPPLYFSPPICSFCGGKYFHNDNCTLNKLRKALK